MSRKPPLVSIIIIHYGKAGVLEKCLSSLKFIRYPRVEHIVLSNSPLDSTLEALMAAHADTRFIFTETNIGYAGGCNRAVEEATGKYVFILNNDVTFDSDCVTPLARICEADETIALAQPKILSMTEPGRFEYSGAAGGLIDRYGYPYAAGRIFNEVEPDEGQYEEMTEIFWASGAALFARRDVITHAGLMDASFFAYMEEIDLAWRVHLMGYKVVYLPGARIFHLGSPNLDRKSARHLYLNHRNNLVMVLKNYSALTLLRTLPPRLALEGATMLYGLVKENPLRAKAILKAMLNVTTNILTILRERKRVQALRALGDDEIQKKMYRGAIALEYFIKKKKTVREIPGAGPRPYEGREKKR
jgi:hypothetical protein